MPALIPVSAVKNVTAAGTAEPVVAAKLYASSVIIKATAGNTNNIYVGGSDVDSSNGLVLDAGESVTLGGDQVRGHTQEIDLNQVYIDADTSTEGVSILYLVRE